MSEVICGDCGSVTKAERRADGYEHRVCMGCAASNRLTGSRQPRRRVNTGRTSASKTKPNMQHIPIRTPEGRRIREAFSTPVVVHRGRATGKSTSRMRDVCTECSVRTLDENGDCPYCDR